MLTIQACTKILGYAVLGMEPSTMWEARQALYQLSCNSKPHGFLLIFLKFLHLFMYVHVGVCACEFGGQRPAFGSHCHCVDLGDQTQASGLVAGVFAC